MTVVEKIKSHTGAVDFFREIPFYNNHIENHTLVCFVTKNGLVFLILTSDQEFENLMNLLPVINENKSHYEYIKDFDRFRFH